jgi:hypothetical protein
MKLRTESGTSFELVVLRYEFPDVTEDRWDSNWLVVSGKVTTDGQSWRFTDPCVTTFELSELADWLDNLAGTAAEPSDCAFTEPNLTFSYSPAPIPRIVVRFAHESAPPWLNEGDARLAGMTIDFPLAALDVAAVAQDLRNILLEYPIRGGAA